MSDANFREKVEGSGISREQILTMLSFMIKELPDFVDDRWPKGDPDRGLAMTALAMYLAQNYQNWKTGTLQ